MLPDRCRQICPVRLPPRSQIDAGSRRRDLLRNGRRIHIEADSDRHVADIPLLEPHLRQNPRHLLPCRILWRGNHDIVRPFDPETGRIDTLVSRTRRCRADTFFQTDILPGSDCRSSFYLRARGLTSFLASDVFHRSSAGNLLTRLARRERNHNRHHRHNVRRHLWTHQQAHVHITPVR